MQLVFDVFKLGGIATATTVTKEFKQLIENWLEQNGTYPHVAFTDKGKRQTTRMVKIACIDMGCAGATRASLKQGFGTIFRLSSAVVFKQADNLCCPVCGGDVSIESEVILSKVGNTLIPLLFRKELSFFPNSIPKLSLVC